ncbi:hypothetical protein ACOMHN_001288 [Nucella lapillus]
MAASLLLIMVSLMATAPLGSGCYQECSAIFSQKMQQLMGVRDTAVLTQRSCQAMAEQMACLVEKKPHCDPTGLQYINTILNYIRPDYDRTCIRTANGTTSQGQTAQQLMAQCSLKGGQCFSTFNATYAPVTTVLGQNMTIICQAVDNYTSCLEDLMPGCGPFIGRAVNSIRMMQQQYAYACSSGISAQTMKECMNSTTSCYTFFNSSFLPAVNQYNMADMCSSMDNYSSCLTIVHQRTECQRFTQQALVGLNSLKRQYTMYCAEDGGQQAQQCVGRFQQCYTQFNLTYFPAVHQANMKGICSSVQQYWDCVEPLFAECGTHMTQALSSVRVLKEQFAVQCNPEFQKLASCRPLMTCLNHFVSAYPPRPPTASSTTSLCTSLSTYFPCVERSLAECKIPPDHSSVDFSQLGHLTSAYCQNLLGNRVLNTCQEFLRCTSGIVLVSTSDPAAMFDAATWCSYMDMSLSCVERAINTPSCGLANADTIKGHLTQQRAMKRNVCKLPSVPGLPTLSPNMIPVDSKTPLVKTYHGSSEEEGSTAEHKGSGADGVKPGMSSLALAAGLSCVVFLSL